MIQELDEPKRRVGKKSENKRKGEESSSEQSTALELTKKMAQSTLT